MGIEAVGYNTNYYFAGSTVAKSASEGIADFAAAGLAAKTQSSSDAGKAIGLTLVGNTCYLARYAESSTATDPVIEVGDSEIHVNDVDPVHATQLEMFALMSYMEDTGLLEKQGIASFTKLRAYASQAEYNGVCSGIYDAQSFWDKKQNWSAIISNAKQTFSEMKETYAQAVECETLLSGFEKWSSKSIRELFSEAVENYAETNRLTKQDTDEAADWREMSAEDWEKLLAGVDKYIDAFKERLEQSEEEQDREKTTMSRLQELQLMNQTDIGIARTEDGIECVSVEAAQNDEKIWTVTCYGEDGIVSTRCQNGKILDSWEIQYTTLDAAKAVWDYLSTLENGEIPESVGSKQFWEEFLDAL